MLELVVAHYKEDLTWLSAINSNIKITVYEKFFDNSDNVKLPNVGREGQTYLNHIVNNYDNLSEFTCFLQGDPLIHDPNILSKINSFINSDNPVFFGTLAHESVYSTQAPQHIYGLPMYYFFDLLFGTKHNAPHPVICHYGAQFIVSKETIRNRPLSFYKFLLAFLSYDIDPIEGYIIERLWGYIMNTKIPISNKYLLFLGESND